MKRSEKSLHRFFVISLWAKALFAAAEIVGGIAALLVSKQLVLQIAIALTHGELAKDPDDVISSALLHAAKDFSVGARLFAAIYLLSHGVVKLWLVVGLLRQKRWYYPVALVVFVGFIAYQVYRYVLKHSVLLLVITAVDVLVLILTWREWRNHA